MSLGRKRFPPEQKKSISSRSTNEIDLGPQISLLPVQMATNLFVALPNGEENSNVQALIRVLLSLGSSLSLSLAFSWVRYQMR